MTRKALIVEDLANDTRLRWPERFNEIPKDVFHRRDIYEEELKRIFLGPDWHMVAHLAELPEPGNFKTSWLGEMPILIVHGEDGEIRAFENACMHRGVQLATCPRGKSNGQFQCPYHRWNFALDGALISAPGINQFAPEFKKEDYALRRLRVGMHLGIIFVTADPRAIPLEDWLGDTQPYIAKACNSDGKLTLLGYQKAIYNTNWKAYSDNEGYHGPLLHAAFRLLQLPKAEGTQFMTANAHKVNSSNFPEAPNTGFVRDYSVLEARDPNSPAQNTVVSLFPVSLVVRNLDVLSLRYAFPKGVDKTEVHYAYFGHEADTPELKEHRVRQASNLQGPSGFVTLEDGAVFDRIQTGSATSGTVAFQMGVKDGKPFTAPVEMGKGDEAANLIRWERYRELMEFPRERA